MAHAATQTKTILYIEDDRDMAEVIGEMLTGAGFGFETVANSQEGLERAKTNPPDLILLDVKFDEQEMDGWEVCQRLKADPATAKIPMFFITAMDAPIHKLVGMGILRAEEYIVKPPKMDDLLFRVRQVLQNPAP